MRYYVVVDVPGKGPYIAAEVVRERYDDGEFRTSSLGSHISITGALVLTRAEILAHDRFRDLLTDWYLDDDRRFDEDVDQALAAAAVEEHGGDQRRPAGNSDGAGTRPRLTLLHGGRSAPRA